MSKKSSELGASFSYMGESVHDPFVTSVQYADGWIEVLEVHIEGRAVTETMFYLTCPESEYAVWPILDR